MYHPLVDRISACTVQGVSAQGVSTQRGVCLGGVCLWSGGVSASGPRGGGGVCNFVAGGNKGSPFTGVVVKEIVVLFKLTVLLLNRGSRTRSVAYVTVASGER